MVRVAHPENPKADEVDAEYVRQGNTNATFQMPGSRQPLPLTKPPYARLVALDMNQGEILWRIPFGDSPELRTHPALKDAVLPAQLGVVGNAGAIVTKGGLIFAGGGDLVFHAFDKSDGRELWRAPLARRSSGTPMMYRARNGRAYVVLATGASQEATLAAFALPAVE